MVCGTKVRLASWPKCSILSSVNSLSLTACLKRVSHYKTGQPTENEEAKFKLANTACVHICWKVISNAVAFQTCSFTYQQSTTLSYLMYCRLRKHYLAIFARQLTLVFILGVTNGILLESLEYLYCEIYFIMVLNTIQTYSIAQFLFSKWLMIICAAQKSRKSLWLKVPWSFLLGADIILIFGT